MENAAMDSERWQNVERLYHATLQCEESQRPAFLTRACGNDEDLRREVESLVSYGSRSGRFIEGSALEVVAPALAGDGDDAQAPASEECRIIEKMIGKRISQYRIVEHLGSGGMGEVYRAVRADDQFQKQVAIKLVRAGEDSGLVIGRFKNERQILAGLDHPNIARLLDGGATDEGVPYFVMELVEGQPIDRYCDSHKLGIPARLKIFLQVCSALEYAHQHQIIHRDIKPANILVTAEGVPKLLDFGIAKILDSSIPAGAAGLTQTRFRAFTPEYASPEQIKAEPISTTSDVYSLGVLLYELLTGHRPYRFKTLTPAEIERAICEEEPLNPSTIVARAEEQNLADGTMTSITPEEISGARGSDPKQMHKCLLGDLDAIVMMALRKEPHRRYASVDDLSRDIRRHLEGLPITARPNTTAYRGVKFIRRHKELAVGTLVFLVLLGGLLTSDTILHWNRSRASKEKTLTEKDFVVVGDFANSTGDAVFDDTLKTALTVSLRQSPFLNVLPDSKVAKTLQLMTRPASTKLTPEVVHELCQRAGSKAYLAGSIGSLGSEYVLGLKAVNCQSGDTLAQEQVTAVSKEKVLVALGEAASKLRGELGESLATVQKFDVPLVQATTSSLEALKAYSLARRVDSEKGAGAARPYFQRAIELDPNFAEGYESMGNAYADLNEPGRSSEYYTRAFQLREHAGEQEKLEITGNYYSSVTGELDKAAQTYQEWVESYPRESRAYSNLGLVYATQGQYEKDVEIGREALRLAPDGVHRYDLLSDLALALQRFDEARQIIHEAEARKLDDSGLRSILYVLAFFEADSVAMAKQQQWFAGQPEYENSGLALASDTEAYGGHLGKARELTKRAVDSAIRADNKESGAIFQAIAAQREGAYGNAAKARQSAAEALKLAPASQGVESEAALAFAMAGDGGRAESLAQNLGKRFPLDTQMQSLWLPAIQAQLALDRKNPAAALSALQAVSPIELGLIGFDSGISCLHHVYVRGEAYLAAGNGSAAAAEFQKILDHSGIVWNCWTGALAHLGVARANALHSRTSQGADAAASRILALAAYKDFLTLWKDADPGVPILKQAKAEYRKLQ
jgi:serine/threonine protein kinase/tetratricopeptide (TPR) repeat protein